MWHSNQVIFLQTQSSKLNNFCFLIDYETFITKTTFLTVGSSPEISQGHEKSRQDIGSVKTESR